MSFEDMSSDDALFEQLEAELEQDGIFDYYKDQQIKQYQNMILKRDNLETRFKYFDNEKDLIEVLGDKNMKNSNYLLVFINDFFMSCKYLLHALKTTIENSSGNYTINVINAAASPFLVKKLQVKTLPTMIAYFKGQKVATKIGLDGFLDDPQTVSTISDNKIQKFIDHYIFSGKMRDESDDNEKYDSDSDWP